MEVSNCSVGMVNIAVGLLYSVTFLENYVKCDIEHKHRNSKRKRDRKKIEKQ